MTAPIRSNNEGSATDKQVLTPTPMSRSETRKENKAGNVLISLCGPAMPLPFDEEYYLYPEGYVDDSPFDYTYGFLKKDSVGKYGKEDPWTPMDKAHTSERFSITNMVFPDYNETYEAAKQAQLMAMNATSSTHPWDENKAYTYGISLSDLYGFEADNVGTEPASWPIPNPKYVRPSSRS